MIKKHQNWPKTKDLSWTSQSLTSVWAVCVSGEINSGLDFPDPGAKNITMENQVNEVQDAIVFESESVSSKFMRTMKKGKYSYTYMFKSHQKQIIFENIYLLDKKN